MILEFIASIVVVAGLVIVIAIEAAILGGAEVTGLGSIVLVYEAITSYITPITILVYYWLDFGAISILVLNMFMIVVNSVAKIVMLSVRLIRSYFP